MRSSGWEWCRWQRRFHRRRAHHRGAELPAIKIASPDMVNWPPLRRAARRDFRWCWHGGRELNESVPARVAAGWGNAVGSSIASAATRRRRQGEPVLDLELCEQFAVPVGFSDHTTELMSGTLAVAAGATISKSI